MRIMLVSRGPWMLSDDLFNGWAQSLQRVEDGLAEPPGGNAPDVVLIGRMDGNELLTVIARVRNLYPEAVIVPHVPAPAPDFLLRLFRSGVADVLTEDSSAALRDTALRVSRASSGAERSAASRKAQQRIAFLSAKGGMGGTVLAANLGLALGKAGARVLLIDLALPFGDLDMYLQADRPRHDLADIAEEVDRLDAALFSAMVCHVNEQVDFVACPPTVGRVMKVSPAAVQRLANNVAEGYDVVLFDFGSTIDPVKLPLLESLNRLMVVAQCDLPSARHASQVFSLLADLDFPADKAALVVNRFGSGSPITVTELEGAVGQPVARQLPDAGNAVPDALARGLPVIQAAPASAFTDRIEEWAAQLLGLPPKRTSLWQRLKNR